MDSNKYGVSPVIGVTLIILITVALGVTVGVFSLGLVDSATQSTPAVEAVDISKQGDGQYEIKLIKDSKKTVTVKHSNGTTVTLSSAGDSATVKLQQGDTVDLLSGTETVFQTLSQDSPGSGTSEISANTSDSSNSGVNAPQEGLVVHWSMDSSDISSSEVADSSPNNNPLELIGGVSTGHESESNEFNESIYLTNENTEALAKNNFDSLDNTSEFTYAMWVKMDSYSGNDFDVFGNEEFRRNLIISPAGEIGLRGYGGSHSKVYGDTVIPQNTWTHVVVTFDGSTAQFYVNGEEAGNSAFSYGESGSDVRDGFSQRDSGASHPFTGYVDEVYVYDRALSNTEVQKLSPAN